MAVPLVEVSVPTGGGGGPPKALLIVKACVVVAPRLPAVGVSSTKPALAEVPAGNAAFMTVTTTFCVDSVVPLAAAGKLIVYWIFPSTSANCGIAKLVPPMAVPPVHRTTTVPGAVRSCPIRRTTTLTSCVVPVAGSVTVVEPRENE